MIPCDEEGRILLVRISDTGHWAVIGGAIEPDGDETTAAAWWDVDALPSTEMSASTGALLDAVGLGTRRAVR